MPFPILSVSGLTFVENFTATVSNANDTQMHRFADGRVVLPKIGDTCLVSSDSGATWGDLAVAGPTDIGPAQGGHKTAIELGGSETLSIHRTLVGVNPYTTQIFRSTDAWANVTEGETTVPLPLAVPLSGDNGTTQVSFLFHHGIVQTPSGKLLATLYGNYNTDRRLMDAHPTLWNARKYRTICMESIDKGATWSNPVTIAYDEMLSRGTDPDSNVHTYLAVPAITQEGFCEADLTYAPNGDLLCFMRSGARNTFDEAYAMPTPLYMSRSTNNGLTWETPRYVAPYGANPNVCTLASGVIVLVYANPLAQIAFSVDNGETWIGHTTFSTSGSYVDIVPIDHRTCLIAYYDDGDVKVTSLRVTRTGQPVLANIFLTANPTHITSGTNTTLHWNVTNGNAGVLNGGPWSNTSIGASGSVSTGILTADTTITGRWNSVSDPGNFAEKSILITVT